MLGEFKIEDVSQTGLPLTRYLKVASDLFVGHSFSNHGNRQTKQGPTVGSRQKSQEYLAVILS